MSRGLGILDLTERDGRSARLSLRAKYRDKCSNNRNPASVLRWLMSHPKVSVVITCYNYARFLPMAVDSALGQTYPNVEVVVVNDGSPDETAEVMKRYLDDPRIVYVEQANSGQAVAKNNGIRAATAEFIAFLDADDAWHETKLDKQMKLFSNPEVGVVYTGVTFVDQRGEAIQVSESTLRPPRSGRITEVLFVDNIVPFSSAVVRRACFEKAGMMDTSLRMAIDWDLWLRISVHFEFDFVAEPLTFYRMGHEGQMSRNYEVREVDQMRIMRRFIDANPGLLRPSLIRWVMAYSYCNRGYHFRRSDGARSFRCYMAALRWRWCHKPAWVGLAKLFAYKGLQAVRVLPK